MRFSAVSGSDPAYLSELLHVAPSLALDPTFGIYSHKTLSPFLTGRMFLREPSWKYSAKLVGS